MARARPSPNARQPEGENPVAFLTTIQEYAQVFGCPVAAVHYLVRSGRLPAWRRGNTLFVPHPSAAVLPAADSDPLASVLSVGELVALSGVPRGIWHNEIGRGRLPTWVSGNSYLVPRLEALRWLEKRARRKRLALGE